MQNLQRDSIEIDILFFELQRSINELYRHRQSLTDDEIYQAELGLAKLNSLISSYKNGNRLQLISNDSQFTTICF